MERRYDVGQHVKYIDEHRVVHDALVLIWWHDVDAYKEHTQVPGCNIVLVDSDPQKDDTYGRQIKRETSVVHLSNQPAKAKCWCWPDEVPA